MLERIITALVLVAIVLCSMFATTSPYPMLVLMTTAAGGAGYEWYKLMPQKAERLINKPLAYGYGILTAGLSALALYFNDIIILLWSASIMSWCLSLYWVKSYPSYDGWYNPSLKIIGLILVAAAITAIYSLWSSSPWWLMYLFLLVWGADSGAYFVGRKLGKKKLAPSVSPNKSIEGLYGGVVTAMLIVIAVELLYLELSLLEHALFLGLSVITVFSSVLGDLFESMIKRRAGIKDSGRILPGHGGVLDRIDSLLSAAPIFAAGLYILKLTGVDL